MGARNLARRKGQERRLPEPQWLVAGAFALAKPRLFKEASLDDSQCCEEIEALRCKKQPVEQGPAAFLRHKTSHIRLREPIRDGHRMSSPRSLVRSTVSVKLLIVTFRLK